MSSRSVEPSPFLSPASDRVSVGANQWEPPPELLGWETAGNRGFGFQSKQASAPIYYSGSGHRMTLGMTGSGKAVNAAIPELLTFPGNAVVLDIKSELYHVTHRWRRDVLGHEIIVIDPYGVVGLPNSGSLNPFDLQTVLGCSMYETASMLATLFCGRDQRTSVTRGATNDEFWQDQAISLMTGLIGAAIEGKIPEGSSFPAIRSLLKSDNFMYFLATLLDENPPSDQFRGEIGTFLQTVEVTRSGILSSLTAHYRGIGGEGVDHALNTSTFDLSDFINNRVKATIYVVVPPEQLVSASKLLKLIFGTLLSGLYTRRTIPIMKTLIQMDEAASLGQFEPIRTGVTLLRGSGVILHTLFQDVDQVHQNYSDARTLINNTSVIRLLGAGNYWQAAMLGDMFGIEPRTLMNLEADEQLLLVDGRPHVCRRVNYRNDAYYEGRFDSNPRYAAFQSLRESQEASTATRGHDSYRL
jgi:type IV secretion system protein VirD4